jgi:hypothetical protein
MDLKEIGQDCIKTLLSLPEKILDRVPEEKRKLFIYLLGGLSFLFIITVAIGLAGISKRPVELQTRTAATSPGIPAEDLFYPAEPDFLPSLLLERQPRQPWTFDDLRPYWTDPGLGYEDKWREMAEAVIDKLMEGVP